MGKKTAAYAALSEAVDSACDVGDVAYGLHRLKLLANSDAQEHKLLRDDPLPSLFRASSELVLVLALYGKGLEKATLEEGRESSDLEILGLEVRIGLSMDALKKKPKDWNALSKEFQKQFDARVKDLDEKTSRFKDSVKKVKELLLSELEKGN